MRRFLAGIGSLLLLLVLIVGIPIALILLVGNPIPTIDQLRQVMTAPGLDGQFFVENLIPLIAWVAWGYFTAGFLIEIPAHFRGIHAPRVPGFGLSQAGAGVLIAAVVTMIVGVSTFSAPQAAHAETLHSAAPVSVSQTLTESTAEAAPTAATAAPAVQPAAHAGSSLPTYTVQDGDSLWSIAENTLGSGLRWTEIAQLNYGHQQPNGYSLSDGNELDTGWVLRLPANAQAPGAAAATATKTEHVVEPGESLWSIAQQDLGDGARYGEIFQASKDVVQPDGEKLVDPSVIRPGWRLTVPVTTVAAAPPVSSEPSHAEDAGPAQTAPETAHQAAPHSSTGAAAQAPGAAASETHTTAPSSGQESSPQTPTQTASEDDRAADAWIDEVFNVRTAEGIGAFLAAGLLVCLGIRRLKKLRRRRPGQRLSTPETQATVSELELRAVEDPIGVAHVDHALRTLAVWAQDSSNSLPPLYAVRLAPEQMTLFLDAPAQLPEPFTTVTEDNTVWTVDPDLLPDLDRIPSAPYPALTTIGQDASNAHILVDLEHLGALNLLGEDTLVAGALTALALELATSSWADDLQITLVGVAEGLPDALESGRIRHVDDIATLLRNLHGQANDDQTTLAALGVDSIEEARSIGVAADAWTPEIILLGHQLEEDDRAELAELVTRLPRVGVAAVATGHLVGDWALHLTTVEDAGGTTETGELAIPGSETGLTLHPQIVSPDAYAKILALFTATDTDLVEGPAWSHDVQTGEIALDDLPTTDDDQQLIPEAPLRPAADSAGGDPDEWKSDLHRLLAPAGLTAPQETDSPTVGDTTPVSLDVESTSKLTDPDPVVIDVDATSVVTLRTGPMIRVLGKPEIFGARGQEPRTPATSEINRSSVNRATELLAFIALHPGSNYIQVHDALWKGKDPSGKNAAQSRNGLMSIARRWLGSDENGAWYLLRVGTEGYLLQGVPTDWSLFQELVGDNIATAPTRNLVKALQLVSGKPFSGVKPRTYGWAFGDDTLKGVMYEMTSSIGDVAHEVCTRSLKTGDTAHARIAAAVGRMIEPVNELFWRNGLRAEYQAHDAAGLDRLIAQFETHLDSFEDGYEPEPETQELIDQLRGRQAIAS